MNRYILAYKFLPYLINAFEEGKIRQVDLLDTHFLELITKDKINDFEWSDLNIEQRILSEEMIVGIYIFPEPHVMPEAKYGLIFIDFKLKTTKYFTLEKSISNSNSCDSWVIGPSTNSGKTHLNFGTLKEEPTLDNFLNVVYKSFIIKQ
jgi:hypothetical protein